jgi:hypothetical protein
MDAAPFKPGERVRVTLDGRLEEVTVIRVLLNGLVRVQMEGGREVAVLSTSITRRKEPDDRDGSLRSATTFIF